MIHGPSVGYRTGKKNDYRRRVHAFIERALGVHGPTHIPRRDRRVLLLDEAEGHETFKLIADGYTPENLTVANHSPAKVATLQRRVRAETGKSIRTIGLDLSAPTNDSSVDVALAGRTFDVVHLDLTTNLSLSAINAIGRTAHHLTDDGVFIVNLQKGREPQTGVLMGEAAKVQEFHAETVQKALDADDDIEVPDDQADTNVWRVWWIEKEARIMIRGLRITDHIRLDRIFTIFSVGLNAETGERACRRHSRDLQFGTYRAGRVPMLWIAIHARLHSLADQSNLRQGAQQVAEWLRERDHSPLLTPRVLAEFGLTSSGLIQLSLQRAHQSLIGAPYCLRSERQ